MFPIDDPGPGVWDGAAFTVEPREYDTLRVYSLPREGTPEQNAAGLEQARLAAAHIAADPWERET